MPRVIARRVAGRILTARIVSVPAGLLALALGMGAQPVQALTKDEARDQCRDTVGRPHFRACVQTRGKGARESCKEESRPKVRACVEKALNAANARGNVPVAIPAEKSPAPPVGVRPTVFVAPPRTITDITALLDSERPDPAKIAERKAAADAEPPAHLSMGERARFYYDRGYARVALGRLQDALSDANKAVETAQGAVAVKVIARFKQFAGAQYGNAGNPKQALAIFTEMLRETTAAGAKGWLFSGYLQASKYSVQMGNLEQAEGYLRQNLALIKEARTSGSPRWRENYARRGQTWEAEVENNRALILEARGQFAEAEAAFRQAELRRRAGMQASLAQANAPPETHLLHSIDSMVAAQARMKARQGRLAEAESDARRALLGRLKDQGKYHPTTPNFIMVLAGILAEQGRYVEAEKLARVALDTNREIGVAEDAQSNVSILAGLGSILNHQRKGRQAIAIYHRLDKATAGWEPARRQRFDFSRSRISSLYSSGRLAAGIALAEAMVAREISRVGINHYETAAARGVLATGYKRAGRDGDALREFRAALPILTSGARESASDDEISLVGARSGRLQVIAEAYIDLMARTKADDAAAETFQLADMIRGQSVQQALAASSARAAAKDPKLAELIRTEQDLSKQINAQLGVLNNALTLPSAERDEGAVTALNATLAKARIERNRARGEIARRFPGYAELIDPKAPTIEQIRSTLRPREALLSFYFGRDSSFVWVVPKDGAVAFAPVAVTAAQLEGKVRKLREALEPQIETISDIPEFDLALAHDLYRLLLAPVERGWKHANSLIVVTNGALGLLPLSVLPTAPAQVKEGEDAPFTQYRNVPWLARSHAVAMAPSAAALRTLRNLPPGAQQREALIGFGDPYFSAEQAAAAAAAPIEVAAATGRGIPVRRRAAPQTSQIDSANLALLPRLPDTADELKSVALSLEADPAKVLHLGKNANERTVKETDLTRFRVVAFSTHGLMPGDLDGLTQPALALSAPEVADVDGDGLLTMEEVLALRLDSDWVVLSACNTATGAVAGAEALSGLGRAFFYAGTRTLLVTNWAVVSDAARELVTDLFRRQAADPKLARAEALRQAMLALMDGPGYAEGGTSLYSYAHPLFWAPYTIIGDGSGQ